MPDKRTAKSNFESRYGGGFVSPPQYLAELACSRLAARDGVALCQNFWRDKPWNGIFRRELTQANRLLNDFPIAAILAALNSPRGRRVWSLGASFVREMIEIEARKLELESERLESAPLPESINTLETPRPPKKRTAKSIREKLLEANGPTERGRVRIEDDDV